MGRRRREGHRETAARAVQQEHHARRGRYRVGRCRSDHGGGSDRWADETLQVNEVVPLRDDRDDERARCEIDVRPGAARPEHHVGGRAGQRLRRMGIDRLLDQLERVVGRMIDPDAERRPGEFRRERPRPRRARRGARERQCAGAGREAGASAVLIEVAAGGRHLAHPADQFRGRHDPPGQDDRGPDGRDELRAALRGHGYLAARQDVRAPLPKNIGCASVAAAALTPPIRPAKVICPALLGNSNDVRQPYDLPTAAARRQSRARPMPLPRSRGGGVHPADCGAAHLCRGRDR